MKHSYVFLGLLEGQIYFYRFTQHLRGNVDLLLLSAYIED
jgi:hypothetical protein